MQHTYKKQKVVKHKPKQIPVMLNEILTELTQIYKQFVEVADKVVLDLTLGDAGHSKPMLDFITQTDVDANSNKDKCKTLLVSLDWDKSAINYVVRNFSDNIRSLVDCDISCKKVNTQVLNSSNYWDVVHSNFVWIDKLYSVNNYAKAFFVLIDLGVSTRQFFAKHRGFSFKDKGVLDMRMAPDYQGVRAFDILNMFSYKELRNLLVENINMPVNVASLVAKKIIDMREEKPFGQDDDIARLNSLSHELKYKKIWRFKSEKLDPATLLFLSLRIAVNSEMRHLFDLWSKLPFVLHKKAKVVVIGFHSKEWEILEAVPNLYGFNLQKIVLPSKDEVSKNPRTRSAKMFVFEYA